MSDKVKVGDSIWTIPRYPRKGDVLTEEKVVRVGNKYFYTDMKRCYSFDLKQKTDSTGNRVYRSKEEFEDEVHNASLQTDLSALFTYGRLKLTTDQLTRILAIVGEGKESRA